MTINGIKAGHRVLVQSGAKVREHALVKGFNGDMVIVKLSDGDIVEMKPRYILKDFEA